MTPENLDLHIHECIRLCDECRNICHDTLFNHALERGGEYARADHIRLMVDCIQICQVTADLMRRNSPYHFSMCGACADVSLACAEICEKFGKNFGPIVRCAQACRECASSCQTMSRCHKPDINIL